MKYIALAILFISGLWAVNYYTDFDFASMSLQHNEMQNTALIKAGEECVAISEQATAHMVPKVEFQKLELAGRKANVVVRCMQDRNFIQNPAWLSYAQPLANKNAAAQNISQDEALENLKRADMLMFAAVPEHPSYWLQNKPATR
ncbi:MAG: hypothetical protein VW548_02165 [Methylotenera sp.]